jgi:hypothetical protein
VFVLANICSAGLGIAFGQNLHRWRMVRAIRRVKAEHLAAMTRAARGDRP